MSPVPPASGDPHPVPPPGSHGGDGARVAAALGLDPDQVLDLSASLNPFAPDVPALAWRHLGSLRRYPDVHEAEQLAATLIGVPPERMVLTAGGAQAIALVAHQLGEGWVEEPDFSLYRRHLERLRRDGGRWRSDPHSPSGRLAPEPSAGGEPSGTGEPSAAGETPPGRVTVWDEAFLPLSAGRWTRGRPGWAVGSLTKAFACPGLRAGYAVAPTEAEAATLRRARPEWAVGGLVGALLPELAALSDPPGWTARIAAAREDLAAVLRSHGWEPRPSEAPWLLVPGAAGLRDRLAGQGVVVRDCSSFGMPTHVRVAVPDAGGLDRLDRALQAVGSVGGAPGRSAPPDPTACGPGIRTV